MCGEKDEGVTEQVVSRIIQLCESSGYKSVAIPAISAGKISIRLFNCPNLFQLSVGFVDKFILCVQELVGWPLVLWLVPSLEESKLPLRLPPSTISLTSALS